MSWGPSFRRATSINARELTTPEQLLWGYGIRQPNQIDLEAIGFEHGAQVKYSALDGCEARLVSSAERAVITINNRDNTPGRRRFSLAHELAHWLCDRRTGTLLCAKSDISPQNAEAKSIEAQANGYASQLVLPTYLVDPWLNERQPTLLLAKSLGSAFQVSTTAAAIKMVKRSPAKACVMCHGKSGLVWHQRGSQFPDEYYVASELHHDTTAFELVFGAGAPSSARREPASRWLSGSDTFRREVSVESMLLPEGRVVTLLVVMR